MTPKEKWCTFTGITVIVALVTIYGEYLRRSLPEEQRYAIPADTVDRYLTGPDGEPQRDVYGRKRPADKLSLSWLGPVMTGNLEDDTWIERKLEERFNVEIKPVVLDANQYMRKKPLMFCAGNIPDLCWINDPANLRKDVENGFLVTLPYELLRTHAPSIVRKINRRAPFGWGYALYKGQVCGIPTLNPAGALPVPGIWRGDWLRNVGLVELDESGKPILDEHGREVPRVPETLEEMEEALRRMRFNDPDGNGERDTYGMSADITAWWWASFSEVFCAFGVMPFDWQYEPKTGELTWGGITAPALRAIKLLRKWREEDLIDPDFLSDRMTGDQLPKKFLNGRIGYVPYYGLFWRTDPEARDQMAAKIRKLCPGGELAVALPIAGPVLKNPYNISTGARMSGDYAYRGVRAWGPVGNIIAFGKYTADQPRKVVRVLEMLNTIVEESAEVYRAEDPLALLPTDPDALLYGPEANFGRRLIHYEFSNPSKALRDGVGFKTLIPPYNEHETRQKAGLHDGFYQLFEPDISRERSLRMLERREREFHIKYRQEEYCYYDAFGKPDVLPSAGRYLKTLQNVQLLEYSLMIRSSSQGGVPLDKLDTAFARFVAKWKKTGGAILLEEALAYKQQLEAFYTEHGIQ